MEAKKEASRKAYKPAVKRKIRKQDLMKSHPAKEVESILHPKKEEKPAASKHPDGKFLYAVGRRKTSVAQALVGKGSGVININSLPLEKYFGTADLQRIVLQPLITLGLEKTIDVKAKLHGGGIHSQAESLRHAISRGLVLLNAESRRVLKKHGFLTRDPRVKERKKPGLKRARRAPQFSKR